MLVLCGRRALPRGFRCHQWQSLQKSAGDPVGIRPSRKSGDARPDSRLQDFRSYGAYNIWVPQARFTTPTPLRRYCCPHLPQFPPRRRLWPKTRQSAAERHLGDVSRQLILERRVCALGVRSETARKVAKIDKARLTRRRGSSGQRATVNFAHQFTVADMCSGLVLHPSTYLPGAR
jgi:hypothetical protein